LLIDDSFAETILNDEACLLDQRSLELREDFRDSGLKSERLKMILRADALNSLTHIVSVESLWAWLRRRFHSLGVQTHRVDFRRARAEWLLGRARARKQQRMKNVGLVDGKKLERRPRSRLKKDAAAKLRKRRKAGRGGAWRAYISCMAKFGRGRANFSQLSASYKALPPAALVRYRKLGLAATLSMKNYGSDGPKRSSFGASTLASQRAVKRRRLEQEAALQVSPAPFQTSAIELHRTSAVLAPRLADARRLNSIARRQKASRKSQRQLALSGFAERRGAAMVKDILQSKLGIFEGLGVDDFQAVPDTQISVFEFVPNALSVGAKMMKFIETDKSARRHELAKHVDNFTLRESLQILDSNANSLPDVPAVNALDKAWMKCSLAGICLCSPRGKVIIRCETAFKNAIRLAFGRNGAHKDDIKNGQIVVKFESQQDPRVDLHDEAASPISFWWHIGLHYFNPVKSTFYELSPDAGYRPDAETAERPITLKDRP
jgi:hypothetical protein